MDWSNIERNVAIKTDSLTRKSLDTIDFNSGSRPRKITALLDNIMSSRLMADEKPILDTSRSMFDENINQQHPLVKSLLADIVELQTALRVQASKIDSFEGSVTKFDHEALHMRKNQESLFSRLDRVESGLQGRPGEADVVELYNDVHMRLKRVESNVDGLEENSRTYNIQFATKDAFAKLLDTMFDQLKVLSATVEVSKEQSTHATVLFDALANAFVLLNGEDSRHQLDLITSFSRDINKDHLSRILTDALMRSVDGSIQAHLKPAMGMMHSSLLELIQEIHEKQDAFANSMRSNFTQLSRQVQENLSHQNFRQPPLMPPTPPAPTELKMDDAFLAEFAKMKERLDALSADNESLRSTLADQSKILSDLTESHETTKTLDAAQLLKLKSQCEGLEHDVFVVKQDCSKTREHCSALELSLKDTNVTLDGTEKRITANDTAVAAKIEAIQIYSKDTYLELTAKLNIKAGITQHEDLQAQVKQSAVSIKTLQADVTLRATKADLEGVQSKFDVVSSDLNILQSDVSALDKRCSGKMRTHDEDIAEIRKTSHEYGDLVVKLNKRMDLSESTMQVKISNLSTELHHKIADGGETVSRLVRRIDQLDSDAQAKNVSLRETQVKVQNQVDELADFSRKINLLDANCNSQLQSMFSSQKNAQEEASDALAKLTRKLDLHEAEILSRFNIRNDRVDAQLMQNQEAVSKLVDRVDLAEHKQMALIDEVSSELRGKVSGSLDLTAQLSRRFETHQSEAQTKLNALQTELHALSKALNERVNQLIKQTDSNIELTQTQWAGRFNDLTHRLASVGDSMSHLAQQQFDLSGLQEKQQFDLAGLSTELSTTKTKLEEKLVAAVTSLQSNLAAQSKSHQSALAEEKYDLLQLTSRVSLLEQLIRYGQDLEDYGVAASSQAAMSDKPGSARSQLNPRPADPDVRAKLKDMRTDIEALRAEAAASKTEFDARLDASKVALGALRSQYEEDIEEIKESAEEEQRKNRRSEQAVQSLQSQIDILQEELQSVSQAVDEVHKDPPSNQRSPITQQKTAIKTQPDETETPPPSVSDRGRVMTLAGNFERMSSQYNMHSPLSPMASPTRSVVPPSTHAGAAHATSKVDKDKDKVVSPSSRNAAQSAQAAPQVVRPAVEEDFDDFSIHSEGSDVFPASPDPSKQKVVAARQTETEEDVAVTAFSPGSVASPPPRAKLAINTAAQAVPYQAAVPDTPDSPWDDESEVDGGGGGASVDVSKDEQHNDEVDDTSSVDSEIRSQKKPSPTTATLAGKLTPLSPSKSGAGSGSVPFQPMRGPSLSSVSQLAGPGSSPAKPLLSGSLLQKGRSSGPNLGSYK